MSAPCFGWAIEQGRARGLPASERFVLVVLSNRANGSMICWPSLPTIAADTGLSPRTVHTAVHALADKGLLQVKMRGRCLEYHIQRSGDAVEDVDDDVDDPDDGPLQPLQASELSEPEPLQPLQESEVPLEAEPLQPLQDDPCNHCNSTLATIASKTTNESTKKTGARGAQGISSKSVFSGSKQAARRKRVPEPPAALAPEERVNVSLFLRHALAGDLPMPDLTNRLAFIRMRYDLGYRWLSRHCPAAATIAVKQGWHEARLRA
jgi:hypothetical protein